MDDVKILELYFARDEQAIGETKNKYGRLLVSIAFNILGNYVESQECENDTYLKAWNAIPPTKPNSFCAYLSKITRNIALNKHRKKKHQIFGEMNLILDELSEVVSDSEPDFAGDIDLRDALEGFVKELDQRRQIIFLKRYFYMMSVRDIAMDMKMSVGTVKSDLSRMRVSLRKYLGERGVLI